MEFCSNGELFQYIVDKKKLSENEARPILDQLLHAMKYVHNSRIVHRDIKPENILIDSTGRIKISDFGLSRFLPTNSNLVSTPCGSPCYASPECLTGLPYNGEISDIWSIGVLLFACVVGQLPWTKRNQQELFKQIKAADYTIPNYLSNECQDLISRFLTSDTNKRITIDEALKHPWFDPMVPSALVELKVSLPDLSLRHVDSFFDHESVLDLNLPSMDKVNKSFLEETPIKLTNLLKNTRIVRKKFNFKNGPIPSPKVIILNTHTKHQEIAKLVVPRKRGVVTSIKTRPISSRLVPPNVMGTGTPLSKGKISKSRSCI